MKARLKRKGEGADRAEPGVIGCSFAQPEHHGRETGKLILASVSIIDQESGLVDQTLKREAHTKLDVIV